MLKIRSSKCDDKFFELLLRVLKADVEESRTRAFVKRLLQLALNNAPQFAAGALLVYDQLLMERPSIIKLPNERTSVCYQR
jgi:ribosome biogenesis protein MAK21